MKTLLVALCLAAAPAFAAQTPAPADVCAKFMKCGTFEGYSEKREALELRTTVVIKAIGANKAQFDYTLTDKNNESSTWNLLAEFREDGQFTMTRARDGVVYLSGVCENLLCTYGMHPFADGKGGTRGNAGMLRFTDDSLELLMTFGVPSAVSSDLAILKKK